MLVMVKAVSTEEAEDDVPVAPGEPNGGRRRDRYSVLTKVTTSYGGQPASLG